MPVLPARHCRYPSANVNITAFRPPHANARNSLYGLRRQPAADLPLSNPALASVAIPVATTTFQCPTPACTEFCALDSWLRHCSSGDVAHPDRNRDLGATATYRVIELD